jgi:branched-chain amino acid transport system permease protein/neutral amino acid transport system permease protein
MSIFISSIGFGLVTAAILSMGAVGFTLQFGVTNVLNIAYGDIMILSAYFAYFFESRWGWNIWYCLPVGGLTGAVVSYALNRLLLLRFISRGAGLFGMVIVTLAIGVMLENAILAVVGIAFTSVTVNSGPTFHWGGIVLSAAQLAIIGIAFVSMFVIRTMLVKTKLGKAMRATASNPWLARASGIHTKRVVDLAWLISGFLCGMAGVCLAISIRTFQSSTGTSFLVVILAAAVLGGVGNPYGAMLGALIVGLSTDISAAYVGSNYSEVIAFAILVFFLVLRPTGLLGRAQTGEKEFAT